MRWIFVTLILLNLLYFGWGYWKQSGNADTPDTEVVAASSGVEAGQGLVLLTERLPAPGSPAPPPSISPERPKVEPPKMPVMIKEPDRRVCARLGPYPDEKGGGIAVRALREAGLQAAMAEVQEQKSVQYWVVLPAAESRRRALQTLRELQARKIDSYLITSGEMSNAISLGLFSREELARGVQQKIKEAGYPAEIRLKERFEKVFWVQMAADQTFENARKVVDTLVSEQDGIKISTTPCEMFAQSN
jgi:hypothetical protein